MNAVENIQLAGFLAPSVPAHVTREIVDDLEAALEQFRETVKSSIWIPGQARNDEFLEVPIAKNTGEPVFMRFFRRSAGLAAA